MTLHYFLFLQGVQSPLYASSLNGYIEMLQLLVHHHAAIDQPCDVSNALYCYNSTSLQFILFTESLANSVLFASSCTLLLCSSQDAPFATPLIAASGKNHTEVTRFLIEHGASVNYQNQVFL